MHKSLIAACAAGAGLLALAAPALAAPAPAGHPATLRLGGLAARVIIIPEARNNIIAEVRGGRTGLARPTLRTEGADMIVDGGLSRNDLKSCHVKGSGPRGVIKFGLFKRGYRFEDLPVVTVHTPMNVTVVADGAMFGEIGRSNSLNLTQNRCGGWKVGDVAGNFRLDAEGWADLDIGTVGAADVQLEGLGDVKIASTRGLTASLSGLGDLSVGRVDGPVRLSMDGMGDVTIRGGAAPSFSVSMSGMGDVRFDGVAGDVDASADGMGDITIAKATGKVRSSKSGMGSVKIGH